MGPWGDASKLDPDWRTSLSLRLKALAEAWRDPEAWTGTTRVGGSDQPGEVTAYPDGRRLACLCARNSVSP
jgi:hypothetical protein